jgi:hypothetical protein
VNETWRTTTRHSGYEVSTLGRVRRIKTGRVLKPTPTDRGYLKVNLGSRQRVYVHQIVCEAFHGLKPTPSSQVDHIDHDKANNTPGNLRWLELRLNCIRWKDRTSDGRNVWHTPDDPPPVDHHHMTEEEREELHRELEQAGWVA